MLKNIVLKEILDSLLNYKFLITLLICFLLILFTIFMGGVNYKKLLKEDRVATVLQMRSLENQPNYGFLGAVGINIHRAPSKLSLIASGLEQKAGRIAKVNMFSDPKIQSDFGTSLILNLFEFLDLTLIVKIVFSLVGLLLAHDIVSGEKELGTLRLCFSNSLYRYIFLSGKTIGRISVLLISLILPLLLGISLVQLIITELSFGKEEYLRLFTIIAVYILYVLVFFFLGVFISTLANTTSTTMVIALLVWIVFVILIPSTSMLLGTKFYPVPSPYEIEAKKDMILQNIQKEADKEVLKWIAEHPGEQMTPELISELNKKYLNKREREARKVEEDYTKKLLTQLKISKNIARISPTSCLSFAVMNLADTGFPAQQRFIKALNKYQREFTNYINEKMKNIVQMQKLDLSDMPKFEYPGISFKDSLKLSLIDISILVIYLIFLFISAYVSFLRYDLR